MKQAVSLKGVKEGYQLRIEAESSFAEVLEQLETLLKKMNEDQKKEEEEQEEQNEEKKEKKDIPLVVQTGKRLFTEDEKEKILSIVKLHSQFKVQTFEAEVAAIETVYDWYEKNSLQIKMETIRSGQVIEAPGDVLLIGNVNPGGMVRAVGSIFIIGELRGIVHAGAEGKGQAVVVGDYRFSAQVRIADSVHVVEEKEDTTAEYEVAYINDKQEFEFQPIEKLRKLRPELGELTGRLQ